MVWLNRILFPRNRLLDLVAILCLSAAFAYLLTGNQISKANWGAIDDHEVFSYLGPNLHLPFSDIWTTVMEKTEVGQLQGRFRPTFYVLKVTEASLLGANVHLWYLVNTICFTAFLASIWWPLSRFIGVWLGGAVTAWIALLPMWSDVWSRLGPSEIFGAAAVGMMLVGADLIFVSRSRTVSNLGAIILTVAALVLAGLKETFLPLALFGPAFIFALAWFRGKLSAILPVVLMALIVAGIAGIVLVVLKELRGLGDVDFYGKPTGGGRTVLFAIGGALEAVLLTWWVWVLPIVFFRLLKVLPDRSIVQWISESGTAFAVYLFLVAMYAGQCGLYRMMFPHHSRYDFPSMLLVPMVCCVALCELSAKLRQRFPERTIEYAQLTGALFWIFALVVGNLGQPPALAVAVKKNIAVTDAFYGDVQRAIGAVRKAPGKPVILEAYGPLAYEPVFSVTSYLQALGAGNRIAVRYHGDEGKKSQAFQQGLEQGLIDLEKSGGRGLTPLSTILADEVHGCISIGLSGPPDGQCDGFTVGEK